MLTKNWGTIVVLSFTVTATQASAVTIYNVGSHGIDDPATDAAAKALFLSDATTAGFGSFNEKFTGAAWNGVRSTISDGTLDEPSITSQGVIWSSSVGDEITTGNDGTTENPDYKIYSIGHGTNENLHAVPDILIEQSTQTLYGMGFWITGNKGKIHIILDDDEANFIKFQKVIDIIPGTGEDEPEIVKETLVLHNDYAFVAFIAPQGFSKFEIREIDGVLEDQALMWAKDFSFLVVPEPASLVAISFGGLLLLSRRQHNGALLR